MQQIVILCVANMNKREEYDPYNGNTHSLLHFINIGFSVFRTEFIKICFNMK